MPLPDTLNFPEIVNLRVVNGPPQIGPNNANTFKFEGHANNKVNVKSYSIGEKENYTNYHHDQGFALKNYALVHNYCMDKKEERSCTIPVYGNVEITFEHIGSKEYLGEEIGSIDLYQLGIWTPYPGDAVGVKPVIDGGAICETRPDDDTNCSFQIRNVSWDTGKPYSLQIGNQPIYAISDNQENNGLTCDETGWNVTCTAIRAKFKTWCGGDKRKCSIGFRYQYHNDFEPIGTIEI